MADLQVLQARREALKRALGTGASSVQVEGMHTTFRSVAEIQAAIKDVENDIAELNGTGITRTYRLSSRKGL